MNTSQQNSAALGLQDAKTITILAFGSLVILVAVAGNTLVIASVSTTRRLRSVTNCFVVSLAIADLLVALLVMPLGIAVEITQTWPLDRVACDLWISLDVLLCTASILNLCCISVDRYLAITRPLAYSARRSKRLALAMIAVVWIISVAITCPRPAHTIQRIWMQDESDSDECQYTSDQGYVLYSSIGSFFIPLVVMVYVYVCIMRVISKRERVLRHRRRRRRPTVSETDLSSAERSARSPVTTTTSDSGPDGPSTSSLPEDSVSSSSSHHSVQNQRHQLTGSVYNGYLLTVESAQRPVRRRRGCGVEHASFLREKKAAKTLAVVVGGLLFVGCLFSWFMSFGRFVGRSVIFRRFLSRG
uniref:G-protein coupled receptors family 1 profile domain-containing protein n=1 Tax=Strigamia maritima TaxID=126957 RepID=T1IQS4_STRMM